MKATIREYEPSDEDAVVGLSLRAWEPVFAAVEEILGSELVVRLRGDWRASQATEVRDVLASSGKQVWVAEVNQEAVGFVAATLYRDTIWVRSTSSRSMRRSKARASERS
jgi:hypothetical protein